MSLLKIKIEKFKLQKRFRLYLSFFLSMNIGFLILVCPLKAQEKMPNVIFISIDDMNDWTTLFDKQNPIKTPNLERLAERGAFFTRAYSTSPACNPSRVSVMTGTRPHKTGIYNNLSDWKRALPEAKTLQKYFKERGYYIGGAGKIFHHQRNWALHDNASFNEFLLMSINEPYPDEKLNGFDWFGSRNTDWGAWPEDVKETPDYKTSEYAIEFLQREHDKPFFLNVGIYKPHSPFFASPEFFNEYPLSELMMPSLRENEFKNLTSGAMNLIERDGISGSGLGFWRGLQKAKNLNPNVHEEFVQAYQAASTFADAMVGRVIDALDQSPYRDNTAIVVWSDHGFHVGEKNNFEKFALWEKTTRVPLIFVAPGQITPGTTIDKPVDLSCLYPTLIELVGLDPKNDLDGHSLIPLFDNPEADFPPALMTYLKGNHAVRKENWRYIQYNDGSEELYDLSNDPHEWNNLAEDPEYQTVIDELRTHTPEENADQVPDYKRN